MKSYEGTEALERRRKQVQSRETGLKICVGERGNRFPFARRRARRRHVVVSRYQVPTTVVSKCCNALEFPIRGIFWRKPLNIDPPLGLIIFTLPYDMFSFVVRRAETTLPK